MKRVLRVFLFFILHVCYLILKPLRRQQEVAIVMYHSISDSGWFLSVSPEAFEQQMHYIKDHYTVVGLGDIVDFVSEKKEIPQRSIAITFDDGYRDFLIHALPLLKKYKIPATLFVCAGEADRDELGNNLPLLNSAELKEIHQSGLVEIGSHGMTHKKLTRIDHGMAVGEVEESYAKLEKEVGMAPQFFAYPKGSFSPQIAEVVKGAGYRGAVSVVQRTIRKFSNSYALARIQIDHSTSLRMFKMKLTPAIDWYTWLWERF